MATLGELKTRLATEFKRSDLSDPIENAVEEAVEEYKGRRFAFNQVIDTFSTVNGQEYYEAGTDIPGDIAQIDSMRVTENGRNSPVYPVDFAWIDKVSDSTSTSGAPSRYAWYGQAIRMYPIPDAAYTVTLAYLQKIDTPASDGSSNAWTTTAGELIRCAAGKRVARKNLRNESLASAFEAEEARHLRRLIRESNQLQGGPLAGSGM